jgi:hypothetical protein
MKDLRHSTLLTVLVVILIITAAFDVCMTTVNKDMRIREKMIELHINEEFRASRKVDSLIHILNDSIVYLNQKIILNESNYDTSRCHAAEQKHIRK